MNTRKLIRPELSDMHAYAAAEQVANTIRLNANEAAWQSDSNSFRRPLNRYPEIRPAALRSLLAARFQCRDEQLLVTRGSSEAIDLLIRVFCRAGRDNIIIATPTFSMYAHYARIQDAVVKTVALDPDADFGLDTEALLAACDENTKLLFLCSPNNPTGTSIASDQLNDILTRAQGRHAVVVDEAYIEFSAENSCSGLLSRFDNLIVLRTLSKALAFAGARCGCVMAAEEIVAVLDAVQAPYALATPVVERVEDALRGNLAERAEIEVAETIRQRARVSQQLQSFSFVTRLWPSDANFVLAEFSNAEQVLDATREHGILLRNYGSELANCIRISIGAEKENDALLETLSDLESVK